MGARQYVRTSLGELNNQLPEFSPAMGKAWCDLIMHGSFPNRFLPAPSKAYDVGSVNWSELVHGRVLTACRCGPAHRRAQALMWLKRAVLLATKERIRGRS